MRTTIRNVVVLAVAALVLTATAIPAQGGGGGDKYKCRVKNMTTGETSEDLQAQIDAADLGDTLKIKGLCIGNFTIPKGADLTLLGVEKAGVQATLDGDGRGTVLKIAGDDTTLTFVTLTDLTIRGGYTWDGGGGIYNRSGDLTLSGSTHVIWNEAGWGGGGIMNGAGTVLLKDDAEVSLNKAYYGGGVLTSGIGSAVMLRDHARVGWNEGNGIAVEGQSTLTMYGWSEVRGNWLLGDACGGGIRVFEGELQLREFSLVTENESAKYGGGICMGFGNVTATMWVDSVVTGNIADADNNGTGEGGGIVGCVEGAGSWNVYDNHLVSMEGPVDNIANGCP